MFSRDSRINFLKISWLNCEQYAKNQCKKGTRSQLFSLQSVKITLILFKSHRSLIIPLIFIFLSCGENAHDNKEFSRENAKPCCESRIRTH